MALRLRRMLVRFCPLSHFFSLPEVLMDHDEGAGGSDLALPVCDAQSQPVVPQTETLDGPPSSACSSIPSGVFPPAYTRSGSNIGRFSLDVSDTAGDQRTQAGQPPSQAEAQIRAYLFTIANIIDLTDSKLITANHSTLDPFLATSPKIPHLNKVLKSHV